MGLAEDYFDVVRKQCAGMVAVYPPNEHIALGDYGPIVDGRFNRLGNIASLGVAVTPRPSQRNMSREFSSKGTSRVAVGANFAVAPGVVTAKPALALSFDSDVSVYFAVAGCTVTGVEDLESMKPVIVDLFRKGRWDKDWRIVTTVVEAANMTVAIAQQRNSKLVLEAKGDVPTLDMASVDLSLNVTFDSSSAEKWITEKSPPGDPPLTPFCWMYQIKTDLFGGAPSLGPAAKSLDASPRPLAVTLGPSLGEADLSNWRSERPRGVAGAAKAASKASRKGP